MRAKRFGVLSQTLPGFSGAVLVTRENRVVLREAVGVADSVTGEPLAPDSIFQICSVSKQITAVAALVLCEDGVLDLRAPISRWIVEAPPSWRQITLHHLLSNTSGLGHWDVVPGFDALHSLGVDEYVSRLAEQPLLFAPGTKWSYSSPGFMLAALAIERASGEAYGGFLQRRIFEPLGMASTSAGVPLRTPARGHVGGQPGDALAFVRLPGAGDVWSTVDDLARFAAAFDAGELFGNESCRLATTAHSRLPSTTSAWPDALMRGGYGYGCVVGSLLGHSVRYHPGDNPGFRALQVRVPDLDFSVVILSNQDETDIDAAGQRLITCLADA
ncbi:serine hydrolase domain-containing protein [Actinospica robiniae]|uniref:serine hydrolase domain-containing protein n=1 Tax=Actinospica robiniae TaxID=304901 RepID=UPI0006851707|nr:serine hydrolase domain-containing protein [Actinospica robiniae]